MLIFNLYIYIALARQAAKNKIKKGLRVVLLNYLIIKKSLFSIFAAGVNINAGQYAVWTRWKF